MGGSTVVQIISRQQAMALGLKRYLTGKPCKHGHVAERFIDGRCIECNRIASTARDLRNKEKRAQYYQKNREKILAYNALYREKTKESRRGRYLDYYAQYYLKNREKLLDASREYYYANKQLWRAKGQNHRARKWNAEGTITAKDIKQLMVSQNETCHYCGTNITDNYEVDHMIPLSRSGSNTVDNICLTCPSCNERKWHRTPEEFRNLIPYTSDYNLDSASDDC